MYCGYYISGDIVSPHMEHLQIIDEGIYDQAQYILSQRAIENEPKQQIAKTTKGKTLLSGNIYCAHYGSHMIATSYVDTHVRVDGSKYEKRKQRYICYNKARSRGECDGQSAYISTRIDNAKAELQKCEDKLAELNFGLNNQQGAMKKPDFYYDQFQSWSEEFDDASLEQRKMIICQLVREINISRGYELEIRYNKFRKLKKPR